MKKNYGPSFWIIAALSVFVMKLNATTFYSAPTGNLNLTTSWGTSTTGTTGTQPSAADFNDSSVDTFIVANRSSFNHNAVWQLSATKVVAVGDGTNSIVLTISGTNGSIESTFIQVMNNATLTVSNMAGAQVSISTSTFVGMHINSLVNYTAANSIIRPATYGSLTFNATGTASLIGLTTVDNVLTIANTRFLSIGSQTLQIRGSIGSSGTGSFVTTNSSIINVGLGGVQTGTVGTLRFSGSSPVLNRLNISLSTNTAVVFLGNSITIQDNGSFSSFFNYDFGNLDLNGNTLTIDATSDANFPFAQGDGAILGNSNSSLVFNGTFGGNFGGTSLFMDPSSNTLKSLVLNSNGNILDIGNSLNITDSLSILDGDITTNGNITLKSTSALKGRISRLGASSSITGDVTIETFIPGSFTGWTNMGVNGLNSQTVKSWDTYSSSVGANGIPMTCSGCDYDDNSLGSHFVSIQDWTESTEAYGEKISSDPLTPGKGFWVYVGDGFTNSNDLTLINTGSAVTGTVSVALTSASTGTNKGFNLVANPYASPISWTSVLAASGGTSTGLTNAIYVWNPDLSSGSGAITSFVGGTSSPGGSGSITDVIPAGQGFYVETTSATNLIFTESVKTNSNTSSHPLLKPASSIGKIFRLKLNGGYSDWDAVVFRIHDDATPVFDKEWDARKIFQSPGYLGYPGPYSHYTTISSKDALNDDYSIHSIPPLTQSVSIPVLVRGMASGNYTIEATDYSDINDCIMLKDKLMNVTHDLKMGSYVFNLNDTTSTPRFELLLCKDQSLGTVSIKENTNATPMLIGHDAQSAYVRTAFVQNTKALISVYNIVGQKLMDDITIEGTVTETRLKLDPNQVVLIRVNTEKEICTKKIITH